MKKVDFSIKFDFKDLVVIFAERNNYRLSAMKFFCDKTEEQKIFRLKNYKELCRCNLWAINQCFYRIFKKASLNQHECFRISCLLKFFESFFVDIDCDVKIYCSKIWLCCVLIIRKTLSEYVYWKLSSICHKILFSLFEKYVEKTDSRLLELKQMI